MSLNQALDIDEIRKKVSLSLDSQKKPELGQFMTPSAIAVFMASLFSKPQHEEIRLLDAGAGIGSLSLAFIDRHSESRKIKKIKVSAYEIDRLLFDHLNANFSHLSSINIKCAIESNTHLCDFIEHAIDAIQFNLESFTHAIMNPPYKKINSNSRHRKLLRAVDIETVNLYTAFLGLAVLLVEGGGEIVAIVPRSFCNGPYYKPFRKLLFALTSIDHIHCFESRKSLFSDENVLQENVIIKLTKGTQKDSVVVSTSSDASFTDFKEENIPFNRIVSSNNCEDFIHIPNDAGAMQISSAGSGNFCSLEELGLSVSTGPVVDFRLRSFLEHAPSGKTHPLLYPIHYEQYGLVWPKLDGKKPNAIKAADQVSKWLYPNAYYAVVKRFSSKEENRRVKAYLHDPCILDSKQVGFENHLNIYHCNKEGLDEEIARGLMVYLNSKFVDLMFREFNGHTQVNATDLRALRYPKLDILQQLGKWEKSKREMTHAQIDEHVANLL